MVVTGVVPALSPLNQLGSHSASDGRPARGGQVQTTTRPAQRWQVTEANLTYVAVDAYGQPRPVQAA
jgi:hypothetical protein